MPQQSDAQVIGDQGERWFDSQLPPRWLPQRPTYDVGVDRVIVVCEDGDLNGLEFRVQVKASRQLIMKNGSVVLSGIKRSTIDYWFISPLPTLIVAYDATQNRGHYCWHADLYPQLKSCHKDASSGDTTRIAFPESQVLDASVWDRIRDDLRYHNQSLLRSLRGARAAESIIPSIHSLARAVRLLNNNAHQPITHERLTGEQLALLALVDMMQHRLVITTLSDLRSELETDSGGARRLESWISSYTSQVKTVYPTFDDIKDWREVAVDPEMGVGIGVVKSRVVEGRFKLMQAILEMIMFLAPGQFNKKE